MESLKDFMSWIEDPASNFDLSVDQQISLPFFTKKNKIVYIVLFTYSSTGTITGVKCVPENAFYFDRKSSGHWFRQKMLPETLPLTRRKLFPDAPVLKGYTEADRKAVYDYLVVLTERIMSGHFTQKMLQKYAMGVNTITPPELVPYYLYLGGDFFEWVSHYFEE